jgi:Protein of unknown function (DUF3352)
LKAKIVVAIVATVLVLGAAAVLAYGFLFSPAADDAVTLVPENAVGYFNVFLSPSTSQQRALESLIEKTPFESPDELFNKLREQLNQGMEPSGCNFEEDIEPWLGKQVAGFLSTVAPEPQGAVLIATDDGAATLETIEKCAGDDAPDFEDRSYNGVDYQFVDDGAFGVVEGYFVIGTEPAFKEVVDTSESGDSLEGSDKFKDALDDLSADHLMVLYADVKTMIEQAGDNADEPEFAAFQQILNLASDRPFSAALSARDNGIVFEYAQGLPTDGDIAGIAEQAASTSLLAELPGGSWGAFAFGDIGSIVNGLFETYSGMGIPGFNQQAIEQQFKAETGMDLQQDVLSWMGDVGVFVQGTSLPTLSGGVVIETTDPEASRLAVKKLEAYATEQQAPVEPLSIEGAEGFTISVPLQPQAINVAAGEERVVVAYGDLATEQALEGEVTLAGNENFQTAQEALGEGFNVSGYFQADPIQELVETLLLPQVSATDPEASANYEENVKPFIDPMSFLVFGQKIEDETAVTKVVLGAE